VRPVRAGHDLLKQVGDQAGERVSLSVTTAGDDPVNLLNREAKLMLGKFHGGAPNLEHNDGGRRLP
jgi:hypothetical protein